jgi:starch-binding outer membrane protein, SusD/RagB family
MKKIIYIIIVLFTFSGIQYSCSDFLEEMPTDRYVVDNFYSGQSDAEAAVAAIYQQLYSIYGRLMFLVSDLPSDDHKNGLGMPNQFLQNLEFLRHTTENTFVRQMWQNNYSGISRANTAIANIPRITMDENSKTWLIAEARFMRGLFYFNLVRFFGDVPLIMNLETIDDAYTPRTPKAEVYQQIIDDLTFAGNNLPVSWPSSGTGRVTEGAAKILLGKVYLTMHDFPSSVSILGDVISNESTYGYGLQEDFKANWNPETKYGNEHVFSVVYTGPPGAGNGAMQLQGPKYSIPNSFEPLGLANSNEADIPTMDLYTQFSDEDQRKDGTFRTEFISLIDGSVHVSSIPIFVKYWQENLRIPTQAAVDIFVLRYSDALLMYAEALNETGQTGDAHNYLNRVRERAFNSADYNYIGLSQQDFREAVWQERRLEFAIEGHRWLDLVRTGRFVQRMKDHSVLEAQLAESNKVELGQNVGEHMVLMPIPQREIDLNPELVQNPGW